MSFGNVRVKPDEKELNLANAWVWHNRYSNKLTNLQYLIEPLLYLAICSTAIISYLIFQNQSIISLTSISIIFTLSLLIVIGLQLTKIHYKKELKRASNCLKKIADEWEDQ